MIVRLYKGPMHGQTITKEDPLPKTIDFKIGGYSYIHALRKSHQGAIGYVFGSDYASLKSGRKKNNEC